jgi:large subunit ribosomal protein L1
MEALRACKESNPEMLNEAIDIVFKLGIDTTKSNQQVRGTLVPPGGSSKKITVCVLTAEENVHVATAAGADLIADTEMLEKIGEDGKVKFSKLIATKESLSKITHLARVLGPLGLFPNVKSGTLVLPAELDESIRTFKAGKLEIRADMNGQVRACLGKKKFEIENLYANLEAVVQKILLLRPDELKSKYIQKTTLSTSNGRGMKLNLDEFYL